MSLSIPPKLYVAPSPRYIDIPVNRYKNGEAFEAHKKSDFFGDLGKKFGDEDLLAKPLYVLELDAIAGFAER